MLAWRVKAVINPGHRAVVSLLISVWIVTAIRTGGNLPIMPREAPMTKLLLVRRPSQFGFPARSDFERTVKEILFARPVDEHLQGQASRARQRSIYDRRECWWVAQRIAASHVARVLFGRSDAEEIIAFLETQLRGWRVLDHLRDDENREASN